MKKIVEIFFRNLLKYAIILIIIFNSNNLFATDYTISDGVTQTSRTTLTNSDTLTIEEGGTLDYYWPAVDADNRSFSSGTTQVTNGGQLLEPVILLILEVLQMQH